MIADVVWSDSILERSTVSLADHFFAIIVQKKKIEFPKIIAKGKWEVVA